MTVRPYAVRALVSLVVLVAAAAPASAQSDTEPPTLVSLSVSPAQVDASTGAQTITVTAVITDNLSGLCAPDECKIGDAAIDSPTAGQRVRGDSFVLASDGSYTDTLTIPQYSEEGVWSDWSISLSDRLGNHVSLDRSQLLAGGINVAIGVGSFKASYPRSFRKLQLSPLDAPSVAKGSLKLDKGSPCLSGVPLILQRKTRSGTGWKTVGKTSTSSRLTYQFVLAKGKAGKYRVIATPFGLGTPPLTTCLRGSVVAKSQTPTRPGH